MKNVHVVFFVLWSFLYLHGTRWSWLKITSMTESTDVYLLCLWLVLKRNNLAGNHCMTNFMIMCLKTAAEVALVRLKRKWKLTNNVLSKTSCALLCLAALFNDLQVPWIHCSSSILSHNLHTATVGCVKKPRLYQGDCPFTHRAWIYGTVCKYLSEARHPAMVKHQTSQAEMVQTPDGLSWICVM